MKKSLLLTIDVEEFVTPIERNMHVDKEDMFMLGARGLINILDLLEKLRCTATFFVTAEFALNFPKLIRRVCDVGELASHGYAHEHRYAKMPPADALVHISAAKQVLERISGKNVCGFRAPQMSRPAVEIIKSAGYNYDSSYHPTFIPWHYNNFFGKRNVFEKEGLLVMPVSVTPMLRLPLSWVWFRNFGPAYVRLGTLGALHGSECLNIYFHSWDFVSLHKKPFNNLYLGFITRNSGERMLNMLSDYVFWLRKLGLNDKTISEVVNGRDRTF